MSKMTRNIIIMAAIIALAVGAILVMPLLTPGEQVEQTGPTPDPMALVYSNYTVDDVNEVTITNEKGELTLYKDEDDLWKVKGREDVELNQSDARSIANTAAYIKADQKVTEDITRKAEFGLEDSQATVHVSFNDGIEHVYYLGDKTPAGNTYYMLMEGIDEIFTVWMNYGNNALSHLDGLRKLAEWDIAVEEITALEIKNRQGEYAIGLIDAKEQISIYTWEMIEPYQRPVDAEQFNALLTDLTALTVSGVVEGEVQDLAQYGLQEPWGRITIEREDGYSNELLLGSDADEYSVNCLYKGDDTVYKVSKSKLSFMETTPWQLSDKMLALLSVDNVNYIDLTFPNDKAVLDIEHVTRLKEDGSEALDGNGEPIKDRVYSLDQEKLSDEAQTIDDIEYDSPQDQAVWFYQAIIGLRIHSVLDDPDYVGKKVAASFEYDISNRNGEFNIYFYEYNADFYAVKINDQDDYYLVSTLDMEEVEAKLELLREGKLTRGY